MSQVVIRSTRSVVSKSDEYQLFCDSTELLIADKLNNTITIYDSKESDKFLSPKIPDFYSETVKNDSLVKKLKSNQIVFEWHIKFGEIKSILFYFDNQSGKIQRARFNIKPKGETYVSHTETKYQYTPIKPSEFIWKKSDILKIENNSLIPAKEFADFNFVDNRTAN